MLQLWKGHKYKDPVFNTFQCAWTFGAFMSSYIALPFLSELPHQRVYHNDSDVWNNTDIMNQSEVFFNTNNSIKNEVHQLTKV